MSATSGEPHPMRRRTDRFPAAGTRTASLVVAVRPGDRDTDWLLGQLPAAVREVVLVGGGPAGPARTAPGGVSVRRLGPWDCTAGDVPHAGLLAATGDHLVLMGADGSMSPREIPHYLHYLESGFDFVKGSRFIAGGGVADYPLLRRLGHRALLRLARQLYGQRLTDLWYGFCAFRREFTGLLDLREGGVELGAELVTHALHYGLRIAEVPSLELPRRQGPSPSAPHPRTIRDGTRILGTLLDERPHNALLRLAPSARSAGRPGPADQDQG
ncbi:glycosyltransferase family 2 protein [Streptomyces sp. NPDC012769]|uniref:glycosyltransferase family 2 protein n=1 Tax=Streptomyces sp. NPDC012769 TaxID=3364848 RepID=UPI0036C0453C